MPVSFEDYSSQLRSTWTGDNLVVLASTDSTNRLARRIADAMHDDHATVSPTWLIAYEQTAGRGRLGRQWSSNAGTGIYATLLLPFRHDDDPSTLLRLPIAVGIAACHAARQMLAGDSPTLAAEPQLPGLKWPNDLLVEGRKLAGILIEVVEGSRCRSAIIGIGLNHSFGLDRLPDPKATSLQIAHQRSAGTDETEPQAIPNLAACAKVLCDTISDELRLDRGMPELMAEYQELSVHRAGDRLTWSSHTGPVNGEFEGFDEQGSIVLRGKDGRVVVSAGDVLLTEQAQAPDSDRAQDSD